MFFVITWPIAIVVIILLYWRLTGRLHCVLMYFGHVFAVLKEEVVRPIRVIRKALSRKPPELDEIEKSIS